MVSMMVLFFLVFGLNRTHTFINSATGLILFAGWFTALLNMKLIVSYT